MVGAATQLTSARLIGESDVMRAIVKRMQPIARARKTTLISGPTGSGKEVVASTLHRMAHERTPYVVVHCGALPDHLIEAELFGHTRGAFTGASEQRTGLIRSASGGTLFLDEIDSLSLGVQAKLLRFLETGELRRVGSDRVDRARVWVLAATNRDLRERVAAGAFRADLWYRLDVMRLSLPALKLRGGDIELLSRHFLERAGSRARSFTPDALAALRAYDWPGNVRELKHRIERAVLLSDAEQIDAHHLELDHLLEERPRSELPLDELWQLIERDGLSLGDALARCERALIRAALEAEGDNRARAARRLRIHVRTMFKKLSRG